MDIDRKLYQLLFDVRRSVRYHNRRRMFFDRLNLFNSAASLIGGSAAVAGVLGDRTAVSLIAGVAVSIFACLDLVVGTAQKARLHSDLARRFISLEKQLVAATVADATQMIAFEQERLTIEADEPPVMRVLDCLCHNEQLKALGRANEQAMIGRFQRIMAQWWDVGAEDIKPKAQSTS
jgi:hypothetical protein